MAEKEKGLLKLNDVQIIGKLVSVDSEVKTAESGKDYITATATVNSEINGVTNTYKIRFIANATTADGKENKLYASYTKMNELIGKKVEISGSLEENRYYSKKQEQMTSYQAIRGKFIKGTMDMVEDSATFVIGGVVVNELVEKVNKDKEVYRYDLTLGQANYNDTEIAMYTVSVNPDDTGIKNGVANFHAGETVWVKGILNFIETETVVEDENSGFGEKMTKVYKNTQRNYYITGGSNPLVDEQAYPIDLTKSLIAAYKERDIELMANAKNSADNAAPAVEKAAPTVTKRQSSLI